MSEPTTPTADAKPKKKRTVKPKTSERFVVQTKSGVVSIVDNDVELAAVYKANPGSDSWVLGKHIRGILVVPGQHDLVKDVKGPDKVTLAYDK